MEKGHSFWRKLEGGPCMCVCVCLEKYIPSEHTRTLTETVTCIHTEEFLPSRQTVKALNHVLCLKIYFMYLHTQIKVLLWWIRFDSITKTLACRLHIIKICIYFNFTGLSKDKYISVVFLSTDL